LSNPCVDIPRPRKAQPPSRLSTEPNVNQCQLCLHKLSIHSDLGLFGHVFPGHIHAGILNVNIGEEIRERRGGLGRLGLLVTRKKSRQIWSVCIHICLYVYIYLLFNYIYIKDQKDQKANFPHNPWAFALVKAPSYQDHKKTMRQKIFAFNKNSY
jgi:hypothetical protein